MKPKRTILCVDDNEQSLSIRKVLLETRGYRVISCQNGEDALAWLTTAPPNQEPNVVLVDLKAKRAIRESRSAGTRNLVQALAGLERYLAVRELADAYLRALQISHDGDLAAERPCSVAHQARTQAQIQSTINTALSTPIEPSASARTSGRHPCVRWENAGLGYLRRSSARSHRDQR